ncbi:glycosyltransferase family 4 protein [Rhodococcoides kroppenstedtii]|uniref:Glycosyltransferase family 4 protein n=2 Tax=Mycobacteriales TaxID=85007 RepID=A0ABS7NW21_9NOCA|nr:MULTISPECIES: glycosyltransferase family 4 protein [Rhodococcus]MBY6322226.1 glycosyltransferase family 4 protein [Rhodococcus kroppenstedtii]
MLAETLRHLADSYRVHLVLPEKGPLEHYLRNIGSLTWSENPRVLVIRKSLLGISGLLRLPGALLSSLISALKQIRHVGPDLIYVNTITQPSWMVAAWLLRIPCIVHVREAEWSARWVVRRALCLPLRSAQLVLVNSADTARFIAVNSFGSGVASRTEIIHNGKDWSALKRMQRDTAAVLGQSVKMKTLLLVGRLSPRKGQDLALHALRTLLSRGWDLRLVFVGDTFEGYEWFEASLRAEVDANALGDRVTFAGFHLDVGNFYAEADVAVVPSRAEPFGTVAVEALAAGVPCVAARVGGLTEIIQDGKNGLLFDVGDANDLAVSIEKLLRGEISAEEIAAQGVRDADSRFSEAAYRKSVLDAFSMALHDRGGSHV